MSAPGTVPESTNVQPGSMTNTTTDAAEARARELGGTSVCPICGRGTPHRHSQAVVDAYQNKRSRK